MSHSDVWQYSQRPCARWRTNSRSGFGIIGLVIRGRRVEWRLAHRVPAFGQDRQRLGPAEDGAMMGSQQRGLFGGLRWGQRARASRMIELSQAILLGPAARSASR